MAGSFELKSELCDAKTLKVSLPTGGVTAGEVLTSGSIKGFAFATVTETTLTDSLDPVHYTLITRGDTVEANKSTAEAITQGSLIYWDGTNATAHSTGGTLIGYCVESAATTASKVLIYFDGAYAVH